MKKTYPMRLLSALCLAVCLPLSAFCAVQENENAPGGLYKDESVYVIANASGDVSRIIVSDWLKNPDSLDEITDRSFLADIQNVKGDEAFTEGEDHAITWEASGQDIYYQGEASQELPVNIRVTCFLDGQELPCDDMTGKSGHVTIRFEYENNCRGTASVNGREEELCVPFAVLTGLLFDDDTFENIRVEHGRLLNDGSRTAVAGIALPGFEESLGLDADVLRLPDYMEISADTESFKMPVAYSLAVPVPERGLFGPVLSSDDLDALGEELSGFLDGESLALPSSFGEAISSLWEGIDTLSDGAGRLSDGAAKLKSGTEGVDTLAGQVQESSGAMASSLSALSSESSRLLPEAQKGFEAMLSDTREKLLAAGIEVEALTPDNYQEVMEGLLTSLGIEEMPQPKSSEQDSGGITVSFGGGASSPVSVSFGNGTENDKDESPEEDPDASLARQLYQSLIDYQAFCTSLEDYTKTVAQLSRDASNLKGSSSMLEIASSALASGAGEMSDGVNTLQSFITSLTGTLTKDVRPVTERLLAMTELSKDYYNFSGIADGMDGQVKFIYRIE